MRQSIANWTARHPLLAYFVLAYAFSWLVWIPLAASLDGRLPVRLPPALHYLTAYGPLLAAVLVTALTTGRPGLADLRARTLKWRVGWPWLVFGAVGPVALYVVAAVGLVAVGAPEPDWRRLGVVNFLPDLGLAAWLMWILNSGLGEEVGWRGYALPRLLQGRSALSASLILGVLWAGWHLPAFFVLPNYRALGLVIFPAFVLSVVAGAVVYTWLYNGTSGSVLIPILFHGAFNFVSASKGGEGLVAAILSTVFMVWAVVVVIVYKPATLAPAPKPAAPPDLTLAAR